MSQDLELAFIDKLITDLKNLEFNNTSTKVFSDVKKYYVNNSEFKGTAALIDLDQAFNTTNTNSQDIYRLEFVILTRETLGDIDQTTAENRIDRQYNTLQPLREYVTKIPNNLGVINGYQILKVEIVNVSIFYRDDEVSTDRVQEI